MKQTSEGSWLTRNPRAGNLYRALFTSTGRDESSPFDVGRRRAKKAEPEDGVEDFADTVPRVFEPGSTR